jgi:hypothetical protein
MSVKNRKLDELNDEVSRLEVIVDHFKEEIGRVKDKAQGDINKLRHEMEFMVNE